MFKMKHYFRLLFVFFSHYWKPHINFLSVSRLKLRVWFTDLDLLMHMNNGVYLSLMDLGRTDLTLRSGFFEVMRKAKVYPVLASEMIRFRRSLRLFQKFEIHTQLVFWDKKYFYLQQKFFAHKELYAQALVKARFLKKAGGTVDTAELFELLEIPTHLLEEHLKSLSSSHQKTIEDYIEAESNLR